MAAQVMLLACAGYDAWLRTAQAIRYEKGNFVMKIVAYLSCSAGRTHFSRTNMQVKDLYYANYTTTTKGSLKKSDGK